MTVRAVIKAVVSGMFLALLFPCALLSAFGRWETVYTIFAHACALIPGIVGDYARRAYYAMTLRRFSISAYVGFGSFFPHREVTVAAEVGIGAYCIIGCSNIGERTGISSGVHVLSGQQHHTRDAAGRLEDGTMLAEVTIGPDCWIGAGAIIMADVGEGATVGAGSVVGGPVPPFSVVMGNPARALRSTVPGVEPQGASARRSLGKDPGRERLRIALVIDAIDDWQAGTEQQLGKLLTALNGDGFETELHFLRPSLHLGTKDFPCPLQVADWRSEVKWYRPTALAALVRRFRRQRPSIVQTYFRDGTYYGALAAKIAGVPNVVVSVRNNPDYWMAARDRLAFRALRHLTDFWQCNSPSVAQALQKELGIPAKCIEVFPNAIDLSGFAPTTPDERLSVRRALGLPLNAPVFVCVANLRPVKNHFTLIEAARRVCGELPEAQFLLVGDGALRQSLETEASRAGLGKSVRFLGVQKDVRRCLAAADVALLTSKSEAASNSVLEYMAMGLPAVLSDIPGNRDLVDGVFFEPGNPGDLAEKILWVWKSPEMRLRMSLEYRQRAEGYSQETLAQRARDYYRGLATSSGAAHYD